MLVRVSREAAAESRSRIVNAASKMFRERGIEAASIADVMQASGMTHGGFYKHFASKNDLVRAAIRLAFDGIANRFDRREAENGEEAALEAYIADYLSAAHVAEPGLGCPIAALGAEAGRHRDWLAGEIGTGVEGLIGRLQNAFERSPDDERPARSTAIRTLTELVGAVVVARALGPGPLRDEILAVTARSNVVSTTMPERSGLEPASTNLIE
jgi:TetR/AcrR family transcriptional repressor of nem operon